MWWAVSLSDSTRGRDRETFALLKDLPQLSLCQQGWRGGRVALPNVNNTSSRTTNGNFWNKGMAVVWCSQRRVSTKHDVRQTSFVTIFMLLENWTFLEAALSLPCIWWKSFLKMSRNSYFLNQFQACGHFTNICNLGHGMYLCWYVLS